MSIPGTQMVTRAAPPSRGERSSTGTWHVAAIAERGPTDSPRALLNLSDYDKFYGTNRVFTQRDAIEAHFRNGGSKINFIRMVGPAATKATVAIAGAAAALSISVDGIGEGPVPFFIRVTVTGGTFVIEVLESSNGTVLQTSPALASPAEAVNWSETSPYIRVRATGVVNPLATVAAGVAVAGGVDDRANILDTHRIAAINRIPKGDGPGNVSIIGATTTAAHVGVAVHAEANNRFGLYDSTDSAVEADHISIADANRAAMTDDQEGYGFLCEGWHTIPGAVPNTTRKVPPSAIVSALMAKRDAITGNPNDPAAGVNGIPLYTLGVSRAGWSDAARGRLNAAGVNVFRSVGGQQRLYGYRTLAPASNAWVSASHARLRMAIMADADQLAEPFVFSQITKAKIAEYNGVLTGLLLGYYGMGALFGDTPGDAFVVDTGDAVNTADRIAERRLSAVMGLRMSEFAEIVYSEFVKVPVTEELA